MNFITYQKLVDGCTFGKRLPQAIYLHKTALPQASPALNNFTLKLAEILDISDQSWDIIKLHRRDFKISYLSYPTFIEDPYPPLHSSITINLETRKTTKSDYRTANNPPILHRRETFLAPSDASYNRFKAFTLEGEKIGLYENTSRIGFKNGWVALIKRKGYFLDKNHHLIPIQQEHDDEQSQRGFIGEIKRHKTAIARDKLSRPMFALQQRGYFNGDYSIFDYGCGRGDDLAELQLNDIDCNGWDPVHQPDIKLVSSDIVNLGFVINVIEDRQERDATLRKASALAKKMLIVSAMIGNERIYERFKPYKDGVITERQTFQKYYSQDELRNYIEKTLKKKAIALSNGIYAVFYDELEEQKFLYNRQRTSQEWRKPTRSAKALSKKHAENLFEKHPELIEEFWLTCVELGRMPLTPEFEQSEQLRSAFGSHNKALKISKLLFDQDIFKRAAIERKNDLSVYFALSNFAKSPNYSRMPRSLQLDVKEHFGSISAAKTEGERLLFSLNEQETILTACQKAHAELPASQLNGTHDFIFHRKYLNQCPPELRAYVGCAAQLFGDTDDVALIKAHIQSGKVTLLIYDDFNKDVPLLTERIKIKLREQEVDFFDYLGEHKPLPLNDKQVYLRN